MMLGTALLAAVFVVKIGGDSRHYRYLAFPFCLATCSLAGIAEAALVTWGRARRRALAIAVAALIAAVSFAAVPRQLYLHPLNLPGAQIVDRIGDAAHHRGHPRLPTLRPWHSGRAIERLPAYRKARAPAEVSGVETSFLCWDLYAHFDRRAIHNMGLTEPILARTEMPSDRPAHKLGLMPLADDLAAIHRWWPGPPAPGMHRAAVEAGVAPAWIAANLDAIERIERRIYNDHDPIANLALALSRPERIRIPVAREPGGREVQRGPASP